MINGRETSSGKGRGSESHEAGGTGRRWEPGVKIARHITTRPQKPKGKGRERRGLGPEEEVQLSLRSGRQCRAGVKSLNESRGRGEKRAKENCKKPSSTKFVARTWLKPRSLQ